MRDGMEVCLEGGKPFHHLAMVPLPFQGRHNESPLKGEMSVELTEGLLCKIENVWEKIYVGTPPPPGGGSPPLSGEAF